MAADDLAPGMPRTSSALSLTLTVAPVLFFV